MAAPPLLGAVQLTPTVVFPIDVKTLLGAAGTDCNVIGELGVEGVDDPAAVVAMTLKV
jgi:hypothetical protein